MKWLANKIICTNQKYFCKELLYCYILVEVEPSCALNIVDKQIL